MGKKRVPKGPILVAIAVLLLFADQTLKIWIKTHFTLHQSVNVLGDWFQLCFVENEGMAFGMLFGGEVGKLLLSIFRVVLSVLIIVYICRLLKKEDTPFGALVGLTLILVGAIGNIVDSAFYGLIFNESGISSVAQLFPPEGGYGKFLHGKVVDMLYFPIIETTLPANFPIWGGRHFIFFQFIFNVADSCVTCGGLYLLLFQYKFFSHKLAA